MPSAPRPDPVPPAPDDRRAHLTKEKEALERAYERARLSGYRPDSREMHALRRAEERYQQAKSEVSDSPSTRRA